MRSGHSGVETLKAMVRPATLDRVENGGSGSDITRKRKSKGTKLDNQALFRPVIIQSAAVLEAVKARPGKVGVCLYGGATADLDSFCARRRAKSTVGAEESLRRGRTKKLNSKPERIPPRAIKHRAGASAASKPACGSQTHSSKY